MARTEEQRTLLMARRHRHSVASLGNYLPDVEAALTDLQALRATNRGAARAHLGFSPETGIRRLAREMS